MKAANGREWQIEIWWRQTGPDEWVAVLEEPHTGVQLEARSEPELRAALKKLQQRGGTVLPERK